MNEDLFDDLVAPGAPHPGSLSRLDVRLLDADDETREAVTAALASAVPAPVLAARLQDKLGWTDVSTYVVKRYRQKRSA